MAAPLRSHVRSVSCVGLSVFPSHSRQLLGWEPSVATRVIYSWICRCCGACRLPGRRRRGGSKAISAALAPPPSLTHFHAHPRALPLAVHSTYRLRHLLHTIGGDRGGELATRACVLAELELPQSRDVGTLLQRLDDDDFGLWPIWLCPCRRADADVPSAPDAGETAPAGEEGGAAGQVTCGECDAPPPPAWFVGVYSAPARAFDPLSLNASLEEAVVALGGTKRPRHAAFFSPDLLPRLMHGSAAAAAAHERARASYGAVGIFEEPSSKLALPTPSLAQLGGVKPLSELRAGREVAAWYLTLWREVLTPHWLHGAIGVRHAAPATYAHFPIHHPWQVPSRLADDLARGRRVYGYEHQSARGSTPPGSPAAA